MADHIRLSLYCPGCLPGYHLPYLAGAGEGLFAEHGLEVEILEPAPGPENVRRVAEGGSDFCLTSVAHYLNARRRWGDLAARYAAVVVQRSPMAALVAAASPLALAADLPHQRVGGRPDDGFVLDYAAALDALGLGPPAVVPMEHGDAPEALGRGAIDAVPEFVDLVPRVRREAAIPVRAIAFGTEVYSSGLVAADDLPAELVERMRAALVASLQRQREQPRRGLAALGERYPEVDPEAAVEGWHLAEPNIFTGAPVGAMDPARWEATLAHVARARGLAAVEPTTVYRPEFASRPQRPVTPAAGRQVGAGWEEAGDE